jgi:hypothetical protein
MSVFCPIVSRPVVYLACMECDEKECKRQPVKADAKEQCEEGENKYGNDIHMRT